MVKLQLMTACPIKTQLFSYLLALISLVACLSAVVAAESEERNVRHTFIIGTNNFLLDNKPFQIRCGEIHAARVPEDYWRNRLQSAKAMGLNTVCAYLFWNQIESHQGEFDWSGQGNLPEFCRIAQEEGFWVILRPGPYACAEWDGGGLPWWLLKKSKIKMRSQDPDFMKAAASWLREVGAHCLIRTEHIRYIN